MKKNKQTPQEYAIEQLFEQLAFMKSGILTAQANNDMKGYLSIMRVYSPALKEYVKLCDKNDVKAQNDALMDYVNGGA